MTEKFSHRRTLFFELDQISQHRRTLTWCQKNMLVRWAWTGPPAPACMKNTSGTEIRRTPDVKLGFVGFNFGQVQYLSFIIVMVWSYSFGHLYLVMLTTLAKSESLEAILYHIQINQHLPHHLSQPTHMDFKHQYHTFSVWVSIVNRIVWLRERTGLGTGFIA